MRGFGGKSDGMLMCEAQLFEQIRYRIFPVQDNICCIKWDGSLSNLQYGNNSCAHLPTSRFYSRWGMHDVPFAYWLI